MQCSINMGKTCSSHFTEKNRQIGKRKLQVRSEPNLLSLHIFVENFFLLLCVVVLSLFAPSVDWLC